MYKMGSPPPAGSKKAVLKLRSVRSIVIAAAKTGSERRRRITVMKTDHTNRGTRSQRSPFIRMLIQVDIKLTAPRIEDAPARWSEKIARSTAGPA